MLKREYLGNTERVAKAEDEIDDLSRELSRAIRRTFSRKLGHPLCVREDTSHFAFGNLNKGVA